MCVISLVIARVAKSFSSHRRSRAYSSMPLPLVPFKQLAPPLFKPPHRPPPTSCLTHEIICSTSIHSFYSFSVEPYVVLHYSCPLEQCATSSIGAAVSYISEGRLRRLTISFWFHHRNAGSIRLIHQNRERRRRRRRRRSSIRKFITARDMTNYYTLLLRPDKHDIG